MRFQAAYLLCKKTPPDKPRLNDVLRQVACIGGLLARKSDGEPGFRTIWLGLKDVQVAMEKIRTLREMGALKRVYNEVLITMFKKLNCDCIDLVRQVPVLGKFFCTRFE